MSFPYIFTFYSFKGGVGRSMAVLNVAYALASHGRRVLVLDMDLEAPGLSGVLQRQQEFGTSAPLDMLDLIAWVKDTLQTMRQNELDRGQLPPASRYVASVEPGKLAPLEPRLGRIGQLDVIPVDVDREYVSRLARLELGHLDRDELINVGRVLRAWIKNLRLPLDVPDYYSPDAPRTAPYDYVLVDSRTGITEIGGLCVGPLSDRLVVLTALNDQNIKGTKLFLDEIGITAIKDPAERTPWDEADVQRADRTEQRLGPKPTLVVATLVPTGEIGHRQERLVQLEQDIAPPVASLSYHPKLALIESVFVRDHRQETLAREYVELMKRVLEAVGDSERDLLHDRRGPRAQREPLDVKLDRLQRAVPLVPEQAESWLRELATDSAPHNDREFEALDRACAVLSQEKASRPANGYVLWGRVMAAWAERQAGAIADRLFELAGAKYEEALRRKPLLDDGWDAWGNALAAQAKQKPRGEAERLLVAAEEKYREALAIKPDSTRTLRNWGTALAERAARAPGSESDQLFRRARDKFARAEEIEPGSGASDLARLASLRGSLPP